MSAAPLFLCASCSNISQNAGNIPVITAHAGALDTEPNTLESIQLGLDFVKTGNIEVDVRFAADGTPVLAHNKVIKGYAVPLADCLALVAESAAGINLDMKEKTNVCAVAALIRAYHLEGRAFFTGVEAGDIHLVQNCGVTYYLNCSPKKSGKDAAEIVQLAQNLGAIGLNISYKTCSAQLIQEAHKAGLRVSVWTVDRVPAMKKMLRLGVDGITTRRPDKLEEFCHGL